ncbi:hypothetical protein [uncultured Pseudomonas sp.]|uniref:hypothetical protein n=1 Tax=uncultured Pseudomonas sp. TaxID=114707 RepID=UPI00258F731C|nr:hypothetical protein [uncultured Pseudomonas sp.]
MLPIKRPRPKLHMFRRCLKELVISLLLGTVPVLAHSDSAQSLKAILDVLLAGPFFQYYYASLLLLFIAVSIFLFLWRFGNDRHQAALIAVHRLLGDVSSSLAGAFRTGAGAILGFMIVWNALEPETITLANVAKTVAAIVVLTIVCAALALGEEAAKDPRAAAAQR